MTGRKNIIALLLGLLYLFPIGYQGLHRVVHLSQQGSEHSCCTAAVNEQETSCHAGPAVTGARERAVAYTHLPRLLPDTSGCPVCEYTFTLVMEPAPATCPIHVPFLQVDLPCSLAETPFTSSLFHPSLRAPPQDFSLA